MVKPIILIHSGVLVTDDVNISFPICIIGCSSGSVTSNVEIESYDETTIVFGGGSQSSYLGYLTVKFNSIEFGGADAPDAGMLSAS